VPRESATFDTRQCPHCCCRYIADAAARGDRVCLVNLDCYQNMSYGSLIDGVSARSIQRSYGAVRGARKNVTKNQLISVDVFVFRCPSLP
jgi:hypothetical protein